LPTPVCYERFKHKKPKSFELGSALVIILFYKVVRSSKNKHNTFPVPSSDLLLNHLLDLLKCLCVLIVLISSYILKVYSLFVDFIVQI